MMRLAHISLFSLLTFLISSVGMTQSRDFGFGGNRGPCFQKSIDRIGQRYPFWECESYGGKIVDCNEALESDPGSKLVFTRSSGKPFTGYCQTCHMNGVRQNYVQFINGSVEGTDTSYYDSGCPQLIRTYVQGVENGKWIYYQDTSGLTAWEINYFNGEKHGPAYYFRQHRTGTTSLKYQLDGAEETYIYGTYENDTVKIENYIDGVLHGVKKEYYWPGSRIKSIVNYRMGVLDGPFIDYNREGKLLQETFFKNGQKHGEWKYYYNDGSLLRTESWKDGVKHGEFKTFFIQGEIQIVEVYKKGLKEGKFLEFFPEEKIKRVAIYKKDELVEEHHYDKFGHERDAKGNRLDQLFEDDEVPEVNEGKAKKDKRQRKK